MPPGLRETDPKSAARDSSDGARNASEPAVAKRRVLRRLDRAARVFPAERSRSPRGVPARAVNDTRAHVAISFGPRALRARAGVTEGPQRLGDVAAAPKIPWTERGRTGRPRRRLLAPSPAFSWMRSPAFYSRVSWYPLCVVARGVARPRRRQPLRASVAYRTRASPRVPRRSVPSRTVEASLRGVALSRRAARVPSRASAARSAAAVARVMPRNAYLRVRARGVRPFLVRRFVHRRRATRSATENTLASRRLSRERSARRRDRARAPAST